MIVPGVLVKNNRLESLDLSNVLYSEAIAYITVPPINSAGVLLEDHGDPFPVVSVALQHDAVVNVVQIKVHAPAVSTVRGLTKLAR